MTTPQPVTRGPAADMWAGLTAEPAPAPGGEHDAIVAVLTASPRDRMLMVGTEEPGFVAAQWAGEGFTAEQVAAWATAECFTPWAARALADAGVTPSQAAVTSQGCGLSVTLGYAVANGDLTPAEAAELAGGTR